MPADAHETNILLVDIHIYLPYSLSSISVEENSFLFAQFADSFDILDDPDFVMDIDDTHAKYRFGRLVDCLSEEVQIKQATFLDWEIGDLEPFEFQVPACIKDAFMFDLRGDDVLLFVSVKFREPFEDHIVRFSGS